MGGARPARLRSTHGDHAGVARGVREDEPDLLPGRLAHRNSSSACDKIPVDDLAGSRAGLNVAPQGMEVADGADDLARTDLRDAAVAAGAVAALQVLVLARVGVGERVELGCTVG